MSDDDDLSYPEKYESGQFDREWTAEYDETVCVASESATAKTIGVFPDREAAEESDLVAMHGRGQVSFETVPLSPVVHYAEE